MRRPFTRLSAHHLQCIWFKATLNGCLFVLVGGLDHIDF